MADRIMLDRYRLLDRLAAGGSSEVWRARDRKRRREVAVKLLHPHLLRDAGARRRLEVEAQAVAALNHSGIVPIEEVAIGRDQAVLVMELVDGESLAAHFARGQPLGPAEAVRIGAEVAEALFHAHRRGVVHRDVKPGNILLEPSGHARLTDFGIAKLLGSGPSLTDPDVVTGTLRYMSPEQLAGGEVGPRTDLYSLGLVLHEMLTGRRAFAADSPIGLSQAQAAGPPPMPDVDPALAAAVAACLQPAVGDRPIHVGALAQALRAWLAGNPEPALALGGVHTGDTTEIVPTAVPTAAPPTSATAPPWRLPQTARLGLLTLPAALGVVLVGAVLAVGLLETGVAAPPPSPSPTVASPTPEPAWLSALLDEYREDCGEERTDAVVAEITILREDEAEERVGDLVDACREDDEDDEDDEDG